MKEPKSPLSELLDETGHHITSGGNGLFLGDSFFFSLYHRDCVRPVRSGPPHLTSPNLTSPHLISSLLTSPYLT
ncbi:hypothetical protein E2C01_061317 [Portunus trituberculatus]|uniref:Uncharacterized protein n=1 Tax=Portunus trituberculatus TaxID=210409 RepID=A0A5B7H3J1_PORTR|nr:hypothetical protein [Portunus trituberculatus]